MAERVTLRGDTVRLDPLDLGDVDPLLAAAGEDRSTYAFTLVPEDQVSMKAYVSGVLNEESNGTALPFVIRLLESGRVVGTSRFLDLDYWGRGDGDLGPDGPGVPSVVEIGATWLAASVQRTRVNTECKLLMLTHAFEVWTVERATFKTDARNSRSRQSISRIGAEFEGIRRAHMLAFDGAIRDSAYFSMLRAEWPECRRALRARLA